MEDDVYIELIKSDPGKLFEQLTYVFKTFLRRDLLSLEWKIAFIIKAPEALCDLPKNKCDEIHNQRRTAWVPRWKIMYRHLEIAFEKKE